MKAYTFWFVLLCAFWPASGFAQKSTAPQKTIDNLNTAVAGEANASHRYTLFAHEADQEGYAQVAKLFRATALAESIHERNHESVLRGLGIEPKRPVLETVKVGTTRENLEVPIKGEANEADTMYPGFVEEARRQNVPAAVKSFTYALDTEAEHEKLFKDALEHLGHNAPADYYVGKVSGDTVTTPTTREPYTKIE
jgi:rubrerythrin